MDGLQKKVHEILDGHGLDYELTWSLSGPAFLTPRGRLVDALRAATSNVTGITPELSTGGGTSDGRFIAAVSAEVLEFGPSNESIHKVDERISVDDLAPLSIIYEQTIEAVLSSARP